MSALTHSAPATRPSQDHGGARLTDLVWLTWRQHRAVITIGLALAAALTASMLYLAAHISSINQACGNTTCPANAPQTTALEGSFGYINLTFYLSVVVMFLPLLIGVFLGAPLLAREHEQRTLLLAWSQDITPQRWLWTKLALLGALTAAVATAVSAAAARLAEADVVTTGKSLFAGTAFLVTGMLPLVQSVAWLAVGVALGTAFRRTLPAIFTALVGYIAIYLLTQWIYPTLMTPLTTYVSPSNGPINMNAQIGANDLIVQADSGTIVDATGHHVAQATLQSLCTSGNGGFLNPDCLRQHHFMETLDYQPASRIPEFHLILSSGYLGLAAIAVATVWWLVRRTSLSAG